MKAYENRNLNFETGTIEPFRPTIANMYDGGECINEMVRRGLVEHKKSHSTYVTTSVGQYASARIKTLGFHCISRRNHEPGQCWPWVTPFCSFGLRHVRSQEVETASADACFASKSAATSISSNSAACLAEAGRLSRFFTYKECVAAHPNQVKQKRNLQERNYEEL